MLTSMMKWLRHVVGTMLFVCGFLLFLASAVDLSADVRVAGPMNMWPPPAWAYLVSVAASAALTFAGIKLASLKRTVYGSAMVAAGSFALILIVRNHVNAPPAEGGGGGRYAPAGAGGYALAYAIAAAVLSAGLRLIMQRADRRRPR